MKDPQARIEALREYDIMDSPAEDVFDDITRLTSFICGTPIALVTLLDLERQWFKSKVGLDVTETPLDMAFCAHAIEGERVFLVPDASLDERFCKNPLVIGEPNIRFYAGVPLITPKGVPLGTLCAIDRIPRKISPEQQEALVALARQVIWALELRRTVAELKVALREKRAALQEIDQLRDIIPMCAWCRKVRNDESFWHSVEDYLSTRSTVQITHGICPDCAGKFSDNIEP